MTKLPDAMNVVGGWIVDGPAEAPTLVFFDRSEPQPQAIYIAEFDRTRLRSSRILGEKDNRTLSPARLALVAARRRALEEIVRAQPPRCSEQSPNTVVLPPERPDEPTLG